MKPEGEPAAGAAGRREFALIDPDGYRLVSSRSNPED
jgi:hypothetical protein